MKRLTRLPRKAVFAGIIAGFADYFSFDVTLLRVLFIFFVLATGLFPGVVGYFLAILVMPIDEPVIYEQHEGTRSNA